MSHEHAVTMSDLPEVAGLPRADTCRPPEWAEVHVEGADRELEFAAFMRTAQPSLLRMALLLAGDTDRAHELVQHVLVRTYIAWPRIRGSDPLPYARRVLANQRVDSWRRRNRERVFSPERLIDQERTAPGVADFADQHADRDAVLRALRCLTVRKRRVIVLRYLIGLSEREVAEDLDMPVGTVKSLASRGLAELRLALQGEFPAHTDRTPQRKGTHDE